MEEFEDDAENYFQTLNRNVATMQSSIQSNTGEITDVKDSLT